MCKECGYSSNRFEDTLFLSLPVKDRKSVFESLDKLIEGEIINEY